MEKVGAAGYVRDPADLPVVLRSCAGDAMLRPRAAALAGDLGLFPGTAARLASLAGRARATGDLPEGASIASVAAGQRRRRRRLAGAGVAALTTAAVLTTGMPVSMAAGRLGLPAVRAVGSAERAASPEVGLSVASEDPAVLAAAGRLLANHGARATFFAPSALLEGMPALREDLSAAGELGNGGTGRPVTRLAGVRRLERDIARGRGETARVSGHAPAFYLPIEGTLTPAAYLAASRQRELAVVGTRRLQRAADLRRPLRRGDVAVADLRGDTPQEAPRLLLLLVQQTASDDLRIVDLSQAQGSVR
jgi:hypothetical protein